MVMIKIKYKTSQVTVRIWNLPLATLLWGTVRRNAFVLRIALARQFKAPPGKSCSRMSHVKVPPSVLHRSRVCCRGRGKEGGRLRWPGALVNESLVCRLLQRSENNMLPRGWDELLPEGPPWGGCVISDTMKAPKYGMTRNTPLKFTVSG